MKVRYRFAVGVVAALMSAGSFATTAHASTMSKGGSGKSSTSSHSSNSGSNWRSDRRNDFRNDRRNDFRNDHNRFRDHCCDNGGDNSGKDCDWLESHDHDAWVRDCE
jgi:hypothetical protein